MLLYNIREQRMSLDADPGDTLVRAEQDLIAGRLSKDLPTHALALHRNEEGMTWAVLTPPAITPELLRFTICRIAPSVMVMIEDEAARRQFRGLASVEEAIDFVCLAAAEAMQALAGGTDGGRSLH